MFLDHLWCLVWLTLLNLALNLVWDWIYPFQSWDILTWLIRAHSLGWWFMGAYRNRKPWEDWAGISPYVICPQMKEGYLQEKIQQTLRAYSLALKDLSWKDSFHLRCCGDLGCAPEVCPELWVSIGHDGNDGPTRSEKKSHRSFPSAWQVFKSVTIIWPLL